MKEQSGSMLSIVDTGNSYETFINGTGKDCIGMLYHLSKEIAKEQEIDTTDLLVILVSMSL